VVGTARLRDGAALRTRLQRIDRARGRTATITLAAQAAIGVTLLAAFVGSRAG
jgi:hypothetical protein